MSEKPKREPTHWPISLLSSVSSLINLFLPLILVRLLTPAEVGSIKIFFLYLLFFPAFSFTWGVMSGLAYWSGQGDRRKPAFQVSSTLVMTSALTFFLLAILARPILMEHFGWTEFQTLIFAFALLAQIPHAFFEEASITSGRIWTGALFISGFEVVRTCTIIASVLYFRSMNAVLIAHTSMMALKTLTGLILGRRAGYLGIQTDWQIIKSVWKYAAPVSLAWMFGTFIINPDQLFLSSHLTKEEFAYYAIGCLSLQPLYVIEQSIVRVLIPRLSASFTRGDLKRGAELYRDAVGHISFIMIPAVTGLIVFSKPIIELLFTTRYSSAHWYLKLFAFTYLLLTVPYDAVARAKGKARWILKNFMAFSAIALTTVFAAVKLWGPFGALSAVLCAGMLMRINSLFFTRNETGWSIREFMPFRSMLRMAVLSGILGFISELASPLFPGDRVWLFVCAPIFAILYLAIEIYLKNRYEHTIAPAERILMVTQTVEIGGLERMILNLCKSLARDPKWSLGVFAYDQRRGENTDSATLIAEFERTGVAVEAFRKPKGFSFRVVYRLLRNIFRNDIQVIHCHDLGGLMYGAFAKVLSGGKVRLIQTQHSFIHLGKAGMSARYRFYEKFFTKFADEITVVSEDTKKTYLELGFSADSIRLIQNGVAFPDAPIETRSVKISYRPALVEALPPKLKAALSENIDAYWILYMARLYPQKGQDRALELWNALEGEIRKKSVLLLVGPEAYDGEQGRIERLISLAQDSDRVYLTGGTAVPESWLRASDVYLSSSEFEGMPLGPLEAAGCGLPTVLSDIPGHEFLRGISKLYSLATPESGASAITELLASIRDREESEYREWWRRGQPIRDEYSLDTMVRRYAECYRLSSNGADQAHARGVVEFGRGV